MHIRTFLCTAVIAAAAAAAAAGGGGSDAKGIPGFWATVLGRAEMILNEKDTEALAFLTGESSCSIDNMAHERANSAVCVGGGGSTSGSLVGAGRVVAVCAARSQSHAKAALTFQR
jgi:hypothetical protein